MSTNPIDNDTIDTIANNNNNNDTNSTDDNDNITDHSSTSQEEDATTLTPVRLEWKRLGMFVRTAGGPLGACLHRKPPAHDRNSTNWKRVLSPQDGVVKGGQVLAIIGPSGAGPSRWLVRSAAHTHADSQCVQARRV
jgi:hypothetical protein